jgi:inosose dehydratase
MSTPRCSSDRFLDDTDPQFVSLCLDTGHVEYCSGDNRDIVGRHPDRISYIHLKQVNPRVAAQAREERVGFYEPSSEAPWSSRRSEHQP